MSYNLDEFPYKTYFTNLDDVIKKIKLIKNNIPTYSDKPYQLKAVNQKLGMISGKYYDQYIKIITHNTTQKFYTDQ